MNVLKILMTLGDAMPTVESIPKMPQSIFLVRNHLVIKLRGSRLKDHKLICNISKNQLRNGLNSAEIRIIELKLVQALEQNPNKKDQSQSIGKDIK